MKTKKISFKRLMSIAMVLSFIFSIVGCSAGSNKADYEASVNYSMVSEAEDGSFYMPSGDSYTEIIENEFVLASVNPKSFFSIDANTASYPNLRSFIENGGEIPADAVRIEEMLNYFSYDYKTPEGDDILALNASIFDNPYNPETKLLTIGLAAKKVDFKETQNNIVFLIDTSGSMYDSSKLPLVQQAFTILAENLNPTDRVSIVTYAGSSGVALDGAYGKDKQRITAVIEDLQAAGSTAGSQGIETAYRIAEKYFIKGGNNRVILATDGDFNVGLKNNDDLKRFISDKRKSGIYFSVFGVGRGNLKSDLMETLALNGNGTYSYIDTVKEAKRALVEQIGGSMITVAKDVKAGIEFSPEYVESFRLIGYENKLLTEDQFNDTETDAGELGSGHTVTVVYEVKLKSGVILAPENKVAKVNIKYADVDNGENKDLFLDILTDDYHAEMTENDMFVSSVVEFGLILRNSEYKGFADINNVLARLDKIDTEDEYKLEFKKLVEKVSDNYSE